MLGMGSCASVQTAAMCNFAQADAEFGRRLAVGLGLTAAAPDRTRAMASRK
jgi:hypothetical protein